MAIGRLDSSRSVADSLLAFTMDEPLPSFEDNDLWRLIVHDIGNAVNDAVWHSAFRN